MLLYVYNVLLQSFAQVNENYKCEDGILYFKSHSRNSTKDDPWRIVVRNMEEKERVLKACHSCSTGKVVSEPWKAINHFCCCYHFITDLGICKTYVFNLH